MLYRTDSLPSHATISIIGMIESQQQAAAASGGSKRRQQEHFRGNTTDIYRCCSDTQKLFENETID
jgi:hypothetical protein